MLLGMTRPHAVQRCVQLCLQQDSEQWQAPQQESPTGILLSVPMEQVTAGARQSQASGEALLWQRPSGAPTWGSCTCGARMEEDQ